MLPSLWNAGVRASQYGRELLLGATSSAPERSSESDILEICGILEQALPLEVVYLILDDEELWPKSAAYRTDTKPYLITTNQSKSIYLASEPLTMSPAKIRKIVFTMDSNDQGWGGEPEHRGTYEGSWTWFEAIILRPSDSLALDDSGSYEAWHVQSNLTAIRTRRSHTVTWYPSTTSGEPSEDLRGKHNSENEFFEKLQTGDRIGLVGRAMFQGWQNVVYGATINIYYSAV